MIMYQTNVAYINRNVTDKIYEWLEIKGMKSKNTMKAYAHDVESFYQKPIETIGERDLNETDYQTFKNFLKNNFDKLSNTTIRRRITAVKEMLLFLSTEDRKGEAPIVTDVNYLTRITVLLKNLPINDNNYGDLSVEEVLQMAEWAGKHEKRNADIKKCLIKFSLETASRRGACLALKWSDIKAQNEDGTVLIHYIGKGNKDTYVKISGSLYNEILPLKKKYNSDRVFPISASSVSAMMENYRQYYKIPKERNITFHSIRGTAAEFAFELNGNNPVAAKEKLKHASIKNTMKYLRKHEIKADGAISMMEKVNNEAYKSASREELIKAIEQLSFDDRMKINMKLTTHCIKF